jgi:hypothetical protein
VALDDALVGASRDEVRERLARDEAWRVSTREELAALERRRSAAAREADVLEAERLVHEAARPSGSGTLPTIADARAALESSARSVELAESRVLDVTARGARPTGCGRWSRRRPRARARGRR